MDAPKCKSCGEKHWGLCPSAGKSATKKIPASSSGRTPDFGSGNPRSNRGAGASTEPARQQRPEAGDNTAAIMAIVEDRVKAAVNQAFEEFITGPTMSPEEAAKFDAMLAAPKIDRKEYLKLKAREWRQREKTKKCKTCDGTGRVAGGERGEITEPCTACLIERKG